ncbi:hypothetical protein HON01_03155 [Candidatus Woesearchaeota archaeon]|jgi:hypothetical protein|nr:hypothetical protein [Candidatus Woesearchaeota archaeon]MBT5423095.1 hypothetical protein [archaeon]MBT7368807.1 hypothetical protein [Candidatus Woesearchaeota archaeon]
MSEKKIVIDESEISYEGLFDMPEIYALIDRFLRDKDYDKFESKSSELVEADGKDIHVVLVPAKWHTDYVKKHIKIDLRARKLKEVETEIDNIKVKLNKGKLSIYISGIIETDWEGRWQTRPIYYFIKKLFEKYIYRSEIDMFEKEIIEDVNMLKGQIEGFLNLQKFKQRL